MDNNTRFNYASYLRYVDLSNAVGYSSNPIRRIEFFSDLKWGDVVFEIIERKEDFQIIERQIENIEHIKKKTHFTLVPVQGLKDHKYCPYSNKCWTMSKQFNPIFVNRFEAIFYLNSKFKRDEEYLARKMNTIRMKQRLLRYYIEEREPSLRRARRSSPITFSNTIDSFPF